MLRLTRRIKDVLEDNVPEDYCLSERMVQGFEKHNENHKARENGFIFKPKDGNDVANALRANSALAPTDNTIIVAATLVGGKWDKINDSAKRVYSTNGIAPTQTAGGGRQP